MVFVRGLEVYAYHGVSASEREVGHRFCVELEVMVEGDAVHTDRVADTVDYGALTELVRRAIEQGPYSTVERCAQLIAEAILARFPRSTAVTVSISKKMPPIPAIVEETGVRLTLRR